MTCPSGFSLDEMLTHGAAPAVSAHVDGCARCQSRVAERRADVARFEAMAAPMWRNIEARGRRGRRWWPALLVAAAALGGTLLLVRGDHDDRTYVGLKGAASVVVVARRGSEQLVIDDQHPAAPGDALRFFVSGPSAERFAIVGSIDGQGDVSLFYPPEPDGRSIALPPPGQPLPGSIVLDAAPGPERLFVVLTREPIAAALVLEAARAHSDGRLLEHPALSTAKPKILHVTLGKREREPRP
jgi:hypothetical protein